jgi:predicted DNA-binding protein
MKKVMVRSGASWCKMKYMATAKNVKKLVRRSISLRPEINSKVQVLAKRERRSANQILEKLIEAGLETQEDEKRRFFELAERLIAATSRSERQHLKEELARKTFGA